MTDQQPTNSGLGIFLSGAAAEKVDCWRRMYDPYFEKLNPHITLAYPPFIPPERWGEMRGAVSACLAAVPPFRIRLDGMGVFNGDPQVLWLNPQDGGVLVGLRRKLEACFPDFVPALPFEYQPHLSIGFFPDSHALQRAKEQVESAWRPLSFTAREMTYAVQIGTEEWQIRDRIKLLGN